MPCWMAVTFNSLIYRYMFTCTMCNDNINTGFVKYSLPGCFRQKISTFVVKYPTSDI